MNDNNNQWDNNRMICIKKHKTKKCTLAHVEEEEEEKTEALEMSSIERQQQTYWYHECNMSIHLLVTTTDTTIESESKSDSDSPLYPHRHNTQHLELMDDPTPFSSTDTTNFFLLDSFFLPFFNDKSPPSDDDWNLVFDSILPSIKITVAFLEGDEKDPLLVCAVCKDEFVMDVDAKLLPCNHFFFREKRKAKKRFDGDVVW